MKYAIISGGICVNIVRSGAEFAAQMGWVPLEAGYGIGDLYDEGQWSHDDGPPWDTDGETPSGEAAPEDEASSPGGETPPDGVA